MRSNRSPKLGKEDWFRIGLEVLVESGPEAVKAARLARHLDVTTGSFYWHFDCVTEFRLGLLEYWESSVVGGLIYAATVSSDEPSEVLAELGKLISRSGTHQYDAAMRDWARTDLVVRDTVKSADRVRAIFLAKTLRETGMSEEDARDRANLIGAAWRGSEEMPDLNSRVKLIRIAASD
jgi:AcrR family transcriptional regulator